MDRSALWSWFLFDSGLPAARAKDLLSTWQEKGHSLAEILPVAPERRGRLGLTGPEAARLTPPAALPPVAALTWSDAGYPQGLLALPLKVRPALLFYRGEPVLLQRPIILLAPGRLPPSEVDGLREVIALLLGGDLLLAAYEGSPQAGLLLEEMSYGHGDGLLFAGAGIDARTQGHAERALIEERRLLVLSPLPPRVPHRSAWDAVLIRVALATSDRAILTGNQALAPADVQGLQAIPTLALAAAPGDATVPTNVQVTATPADAVLWVESLLPGHGVAADEEIRDDTWSPDSLGMTEDDPGAIPSPDEILDTLRRGGVIPEALRRRLAGQG